MCLFCFVLLLIFLFGLFVVQVVMVYKIVIWIKDGIIFCSVLVYDNVVVIKCFGLVMVLNWYGVNVMVVKKVEMIVGKQYVILVIDFYGEGVWLVNNDQVQVVIKLFYGN